MNSDAFRTLQTLVLANLPKMNAQGLANVAWAFAKMERDPGADALAAIAAGLAAELGKNAKPRANDGGRRSSREHHGGVRPQAVSNTLWAFGQLDYSPRRRRFTRCARARRRFSARFARRSSPTPSSASPGSSTTRGTRSAAPRSRRERESEELRGTGDEQFPWACARFQRARLATCSTRSSNSPRRRTSGGWRPGRTSRSASGRARSKHASSGGVLPGGGGRDSAVRGRLQPEHLDCVLWALASMNARVSEEARMALSSAAARLAPRMDAELLVKTRSGRSRGRARPSPSGTRAQSRPRPRRCGASRRTTGSRRCTRGGWSRAPRGRRPCAPSPKRRRRRRRFDEGELSRPLGSSSDASPRGPAGWRCSAPGRSCGPRGGPAPAPAAHAAALREAPVRRGGGGRAPAPSRRRACRAGGAPSRPGSRMGTDGADAPPPPAARGRSRAASRPGRSPRSAWGAAAALGYDPTRADPRRSGRAAAAMPRRAPPDQEARWEAMVAPGDRGWEPWATLALQTALPAIVAPAAA